MPNCGNICEKCARFDERRNWCTSPELCPTQNTGLIIHKRGPYFRVGPNIYDNREDAYKMMKTQQRDAKMEQLVDIETAARMRNAAEAAEAEMMARHGVRKTALGYRARDREFSTLNAALIYAQRPTITNEKPMFTLKGDLHQMSEQKAFLERQGFRVGQNDVYPGLYSREDFERAVVAIWENEVPGYMNYDVRDFPSNYMTTPRSNLPKKHEREAAEKEKEKKTKKKRDRWEAVKV